MLQHEKVAQEWERAAEALLQLVPPESPGRGGRMVWEADTESTSLRDVLYSEFRNLGQSLESLQTS